MTAVTTTDAIVIGTGVIGTAVAYELCKLGIRTLSLDRNSQIGHGSTAGSCAIIRMHYSTREGTAFAWEGYHYWRDWPEYLGLPATETLAQFKECGCLVMQTDANGMLVNHVEHSTALSIPHDIWDVAAINERLPVYSLQSFAPPKRPEHDKFGEPNGKSLNLSLIHISEPTRPY